MRRYRIYTQHQPHGLRKLVERFLESYTVYHAVGVWKCKKEHAVVIEVMGPVEQLASKVSKLASAIKRDFNQKAVLVTDEHLKGVTIV